MSPQRWRGVLDLVDETDKILEELNRAANELGVAMSDPLDRASAIQRIKRLAANARSANHTSRLALERHTQITPT